MINLGIVKTQLQHEHHTCAAANPSAPLRRCALENAEVALRAQIAASRLSGRLPPSPASHPLPSGVVAVPTNACGVADPPPDAAFASRLASPARYMGLVANSLRITPATPPLSPTHIRAPRPTSTRRRARAAPAAPRAPSWREGGETRAGFGAHLTTSLVSSTNWYGDHPTMSLVSSRNW